VDVEFTPGSLPSSTWNCDPISTCTRKDRELAFRRSTLTRSPSGSGESGLTRGAPALAESRFRRSDASAVASGPGAAAASGSSEVAGSSA
jgi:hypothetical protein